MLNMQITAAFSTHSRKVPGRKYVSTRAAGIPLEPAEHRTGLAPCKGNTVWASKRRGMKSYDVRHDEALSMPNRASSLDLIEGKIRICPRNPPFIGIVQAHRAQPRVDMPYFFIPPTALAPAITTMSHALGSGCPRDEDGEAAI
jgi:hypothetical protein